MITKWSNAYKKNQGHPTPIFMPITKRELFISGKKLIREKAGARWSMSPPLAPKA